VVDEALVFYDKQNDGPSIYGNLTMRAGSVAALDPELSRTDGVKIHVTVPQEYLMIGIPADLDMANPSAAELMVEADFQKLTTQPCEDLMIRKVTVQGSKLGTNITKLEFSIADDAFSNSSTAVLGLKVTNKREDGREQEITFSDTLPASALIKPVEHFTLYAVYCTVSRARGFIKPPTKHSFRFRQPLFEVECSLDYGTHDIKIVFNSVWRGNNGVRDILANDLSLYISNVGGGCSNATYHKDPRPAGCDHPAGLLGGDPYEEATRPIAGCNKSQPLMGPFKYLASGSRRPKGKPHRRHFR
jgi:hypothetical protein